jgi:hypothetical protein
MQQSVNADGLTLDANSCGKGTMMGVGRIKLAIAMPLRAAFALAFIVLSSLQPGLFANANATGFHADNGITLSADVPDHHSVDGGHDGHAEAVAPDAADHHGSSSANDTSCEVHCAPIHGFPAAYQPVLQASVGCRPEVAVAVLQPSAHAEFIRPPRSLT